jgi:hypothetical protein
MLRLDSPVETSWVSASVARHGQNNLAALQFTEPRPLELMSAAIHGLDIKALLSIGRDSEAETQVIE